MTRKKGVALIICLTLIISMALPGTLAFSGDPSAANENLTLAEDPSPHAGKLCGRKGLHLRPKARRGRATWGGCPFYTSVMGTAAAAVGTDSPVTESAAGQIRIKINVFCVDDSNEAIPQPGVRVEVRRELYGNYDGENAQLSGWNDELPMFSGTSDEKGVVEIEVPYTVVKYPDNAANDTAYLGNGETNDNDHVVYQRRADTDAFCIRFAIEPVNGSGYALNGADQKIRNWKNGQNGINVHSSDGDVYVPMTLSFRVGLWTSIVKQVPPAVHLLSLICM